MSKEVKAETISVEAELVRQTLINHKIENSCFDRRDVKLSFEETKHFLGYIPAKMGDTHVAECSKDRVAKLWREELFWGLNWANFPTIAEFDEGVEGVMVTQSRIDVRSMCEHHFLPIIGFCDIQYKPKGKVIGLSKLNRIVEFFSRRPQIQERLTKQIKITLMTLMELPESDVFVKIEASHSCVSMRGVKQDSVMITTL